jgi:hypothetical protein
MTSSARLQQDATVARAGLSNALDELRASVTTTALTNGAMTFAKDGSSALAKAAVDRALASPFAAMLIGAGIVMLMSSDKTSGVGSVVEKGNSLVRDTAAKLGTAGKAVAGAASSALSATKDASSSVVDTASGVADQVSSTAAQATDVATGTYDRAKSLILQGQQQGAATLQDAQKMIADSRTKLEKFAAEQPILVAALGVAFGAALGASLPMTEAEKSFMGDAGRKVTAKATEIGKAVADSVTDKISGGDVSQKIGDVVEAAASTVTSSLSPRS